MSARTVPGAGTTMVVSDLDGTLTFAGSQPEPVVLAAWDEVMATPGVQVALATARSPRCIRAWFGARLERIDLICCNGALVVPSAGRVQLHPLPVAALRLALARLRASAGGYCVEYGDYFVASSPHALPWMGHTHRRVLPAGQEPALEGVLKLSVATSLAAHRAVTGLPGLRVLAHTTGDADVMAAGVGKEVAAAGLRRPGMRLVALGNDENDRGLLWSADEAYLIGSGLPDLDVVPHLRRVAATPSAVATALAGLTSGRSTASAPGC